MNGPFWKIDDFINSFWLYLTFNCVFLIQVQIIYALGQILEVLIENFETIFWIVYHVVGRFSMQCFDVKMQIAEFRNLPVQTCLFCRLEANPKIEIVKKDSGKNIERETNNP